MLFRLTKHPFAKNSQLNNFEKKAANMIKSNAVS